MKSAESAVCACRNSQPGRLRFFQPTETPQTLNASNTANTPRMIRWSQRLPGWMGEVLMNSSKRVMKERRKENELARRGSPLRDRNGPKIGKFRGPRRNVASYLPSDIAE